MQRSAAALPYAHVVARSPPVQMEKAVHAAAADVAAITRHQSQLLMRL
jgi:hypothetical protein